MTLRAIPAVLTVCLIPAGVWAQASDQTPKRETMQEAIAFERHKEAAAKRQERIEARHPSAAQNNADRSNADREQGAGRPAKDEKAPGAKPDRK